MINSITERRYRLSHSELSFLFYIRDAKSEKNYRCFIEVDSLACWASFLSCRIFFQFSFSCSLFFFIFVFFCAPYLQYYSMLLRKKLIVTNSPTNIPTYRRTYGRNLVDRVKLSMANFVDLNKKAQLFIRAIMAQY